MSFMTAKKQMHMHLFYFAPRTSSMLFKAASMRTFSNMQYDVGINYYRRLGVQETASQEDIKQKFYEMAKKHHPDSSESKPSDEERFKAISAAYDILSNGSLKSQYDAARSPKSNSSSASSNKSAAEAYGGFNHNYKARTRGTYTYNHQKGGFSGAGSQS